MSRAKGKAQRKYQTEKEKGSCEMVDVLNTEPMTDMEALRYAQWWLGLPLNQKPILAGLGPFDSVKVGKVLVTMVADGSDEHVGRAYGYRREARQYVQRAKEANRAQEAAGSDSAGQWDRGAMRQNAADLAEEVRQRLSEGR